MKKILVCMLVLLFAALRVNATITATIGSASAASNSVVTIPITVTGVTGDCAFWGFELKINYAPAQFGATKTYQNQTTLIGSGGWIPNPNYNATTMFIGYENGSSFNNITLPDGTILLEIQMTYTGSTATTLSWDTQNSFFMNVSGTNVSVNWVNGTITPAVGPSAPTLSSPANSSTGIQTNPTLAWNAATNATSYRVQVSTSNTFSPLAKNEVVSSTSKALTGLAIGTTYYWRVCSKTATDSSAWSSVWIFTTTNVNIAPVPASWTPTENTGTTANIGLISSGTFTVDGRPFQNGDAIGAFYLDGTQKKCAGYLLWNSSTYGFVVWGDDEFTNSVKEGFANGEAFTFKVWNSLTAQEATYVNITYQSGNQTFAANGLTFISAVSALTQITQNIPLANGWNMISSYVMPANDTISNIVAPISNSLVIIKDAFGRSLWPGFMNNLTKWDYKNAYVTKVNAACSLSITGQKIIPENTPWMMNNTGWHWIPYYRTTSMNTLEAIASVTANYRIIKSINGQSYWPGFMTTLTQLEPGKGYMIYMNAADTLLYPSNPPSSKIAPSAPNAEPQFFALEPKNTGNTANIALLFDSKYDGSEVGVFSSNNELIGSAVVANGKAGVAVWGDDAMTSIVEGAVESEVLKFKLYDTKTNSTKEIELTNVLDIVENANRDDVAYTTNGIFMANALVKEMVSAEDATLGSDLQVIPNPVVEISTVKYSVGDCESFVLELFSLDGNKVATLANGSASAGVYSAVIDSKELASGVYTLVFRSGMKHTSKQIVIVK